MLLTVKKETFSTAAVCCWKISPPIPPDYSRHYFLFESTAVVVECEGAMLLCVSKLAKAK